MAYIYIITNKINGTQYVGKTTESIEERWKDHIYEKDKRRAENRPLYRAFNKYGIENFKIEQLEKCSVEILSEREQYWIDKIDTYNNGYNATKGGDGSLLYNYKTLSEKYKELQNLQETAKFFNCDRDTVKRACIEYNIKIKNGTDISKERKGKKIKMCDLQTKNTLKEFNDQSDAARWLIENNITKATIKSISTNIGRVAKGKRKSCYGFFWKY